MITANLYGGLGNQMFQIAATFAHAKNLETDYFFDFSKSHILTQGNQSNKYKNNMEELNVLINMMPSPFNFIVDYYKENDLYLFGVYIGNAPMLKKSGFNLTEYEQIELSKECLNEFFIKLKGGVYKGCF